MSPGPTSNVSTLPPGFNTIRRAKPSRTYPNSDALGCQ